MNNDTSGNNIGAVKYTYGNTGVFPFIVLQSEIICDRSQFFALYKNCMASQIVAHDLSRGSITVPTIPEGPIVVNLWDVLDPLGQHSNDDLIYEFRRLDTALSRDADTIIINDHFGWLASDVIIPLLYTSSSTQCRCPKCAVKYGVAELTRERWSAVTGEGVRFLCPRRHCVMAITDLTITT